MGKKNKQKKDEPTDNKGASQQQTGQNPNTASRNTGPPRDGGGDRRDSQQQSGDRSQQRAAGQQRGPDEQNQSGGGQQRRGNDQQRRGNDQQRRGNDQQRGVSGQQSAGGQQQRGSDQQRGSSGQQQQSAGGQQQRRGDQQQGAWGQQSAGGQQQRGSDQQRGASGQQQQSAGGQQQRRGDQQQGAWGQQSAGGQQQGVWGQQSAGGQQQRGSDQQRGASGQQQQSAGGQQQRRNDQQQGAWGQQSAGGQQQRGSDQQRGASGPQQQSAGGQQQRRNDQQQGAWGQQSAGGQQQRGTDQQRQGGGGQPRYNQQQSGGGQQHRGSRPQDESGQQRGPNQRTGYQQRDSGYQQGGSQQQYGRGQQGQQMHGRNQQQQQTAPLHQQMQKCSISNETPLPVQEKSCSGIVRGTLGKPGTVEVNYLRLNLDKMPNEAFHYDVTITPDKPKKFLRPAFEQFRSKMCPDVTLTFDGVKSCYSIKRLDAPRMECKVEVLDSGNRMKEFQVEVKETDTVSVDMNSLRNYQKERIFDKPMRALQVLEVVLASSNHERGVRVGRSFFRPPRNPYSLGDGYEAWTGLYQAAILGEMPLLNVDIAHKSFPSQSTVLEYLDTMGVDKNNDMSYNKEVCDFLKGINIEYKPPESFAALPKRYKVLNVGEPANIKTFKDANGLQLTVAEYFKSKKHPLTYPKLNVLNVGSTVKQVSLPMEFCSIPGGQALNRKDQSRQVEKMVRYAATSTNMRKDKIMDLLHYFEHNANPIIRDFGLTIGSSFIKVPMRMLPSPYMEYLQGRTVTTFKGAWRMDNMKFLVCATQTNGHKWAIIFDERSRTSHHQVEQFKKDVIETSKKLNMNLQSTADIKRFNLRQLQSTLRQYASDKYDLVFVVLDDRGSTYPKVKQVAELEVGVLTQCIKDKTVFKCTKGDMTVFSNILLKVNGKLNGTNHKIAQDKTSNLLTPIKKVMYLGADVTHPSPDQRHIPSVVGVAASHDAYGACYNCQYRLQRSTVENIEDMESIARRHLEVYKKYQNCYPDQIIYYRDGVSDGQFPIVEREELRAIRNACKNLRCNPKLTCVIVVKRHHTRFFPLTQPQHDRDFNNVQAGTVVDQHITHPNEVQFFMVSHQSIQGTARPTRYNVIVDDSKFDINLLQKLTYNLCHLFPRCNRAVSYPAPAYLAHLVAFRGRVYLEGCNQFGNLKTEYEKRQIKMEFLNRNPMYFI